MGFGSNLAYGLGLASQSMLDIQERRKKEAAELIRQQLIQQQLRNAMFEGEEAQREAGRRQDLFDLGVAKETQALKQPYFDFLADPSAESIASAAASPESARMIDPSVDVGRTFEAEKSKAMDVALGRRAKEANIEQSEAGTAYDKARLDQLLNPAPPSELDRLKVQAETADAQAKLAKAQDTLNRLGRDKQQELLDEVLRSYPIDPDTGELTTEAQKRLDLLRTVASVSSRVADVERVNEIEAMIELAKAGAKQILQEQQSQGGMGGNVPDMSPATQRPSSVPLPSTPFGSVGGVGTTTMPTQLPSAMDIQNMTRRLVGANSGNTQNLPIPSAPAMPQSRPAQRVLPSGPSSNIPNLGVPNMPFIAPAGSQDSLGFVQRKKAMGVPLTPREEELLKLIQSGSY